jgi:hypothetical protein
VKPLEIEDVTLGKTEFTKLVTSKSLLGYYPGDCKGVDRHNSRRNDFIFFLDREDRHQPVHA